MKNSRIALKNSEYSELNFWDLRYGENDAPQREWLGDYQMFGEFFRQKVSRKASILILGCGNSLLSEQLYDDGYENVHNIDISPLVIETMSKHCDKCKQMKWYTMDCRQMMFADESFDVIVEKATLDVFLVAEKSSWTVSDQAIQLLESVAREIIRVLKNDHGQFFSITFSAPHFRQPLLEKIFKDALKTSQIKQLGTEFHYYLYHLIKDQSIPSIRYWQYQPPTSTTTANSQMSLIEDEDQSCDQNFLSNIEL